MVLVRVMPFWGQLQLVCELRIADQRFDAFQDISMVHIKLFAGNCDFTFLELGAAREIVDNGIEFPGVCV